jgi:hypothetical protein
VPVGLSAAGVATGLAGLVAAWWWQRRAQRGFAARRAAIFDDCRAMLERAELARPGSDYPLLRGAYSGRRFLLQPLLDHVGYRKVPSLWLVITSDEPLPVGGSVDILFRPANIEFYSGIDGLPERIHLPPEWPVHHMARVGPAGWKPPLATMRAALGDAGDNPDLKEVVLTPRGVRLVVRVCDVERSHYMVLRSMLPQVERIPPEWLAYWLDTVAALADSVREPVGEQA